MTPVDLDALKDAKKPFLLWIWRWHDINRFRCWNTKFYSFIYFLTHSLWDQTGAKTRANNMLPFKLDSYVLKCLLKAIKWYKV